LSRKSGTRFTVKWPILLERFASATASPSQPRITSSTSQPASVIARQRHGADRARHHGIASSRPTTTTAGSTHDAATDQLIAHAGFAHLAECDSLRGRHNSEIKSTGQCTSGQLSIAWPLSLDRRGTKPIAVPPRSPQTPRPQSPQTGAAPFLVMFAGRLGAALTVCLPDES
jgi:hypothetical protein